MWFNCGSCGFERTFDVAPAQHARTCPVCGLGTLVPGQAASGFSLVRNDIVPRNIAVPACSPVWTGKELSADSFNYFVGLVGGRYQQFIRENTTYLGRFTNIVVPAADQFAWLTPYTGNKHNRMYFTQLLLTMVARRQFVANGGKLPRLIEPFLGSGQVFLNACAWGPSLNDGVPPFKEVIGGDLNPYLIAGYRLILDNLIDDYLTSAQSLDANVAQSFQDVLHELDINGRNRLAMAADNPGLLHEAASMFIWIVNRCLRATTLVPGRGVAATLNPGLDLTQVRAREKDTMKRVRAMLRGIRFSCAVRDFADTCDLARPDDVVFLDCPFPKFTATVPKVFPADPETADSVPANTYGTGDDGAALQTRIVRAAGELASQGTTVILCNFANPGLVASYRNQLVGVAEEVKRHYVFTYRSPATQSEAYQVMILPGDGKDFSDLPAQLMQRWLDVGGDNGWNVGHQEFFDGPLLDEMTLESQ